MANQIIQSIKTIAQSLVDDAGYDKTRGGVIVATNQATNTYSVKVDGITYPIVRAVDDATYNTGDIVKVVIPCNQATQMYISSSVLSDNSLGNKIANATTLAEDAKQLGLDNQVEIKDSVGYCYSPIRCSIKSSGDIFVEILVVVAGSPMTYAQLVCTANQTRFYRNAWWQIEATKK